MIRAPLLLLPFLFTPACHGEGEAEEAPADTIFEGGTLRIDAVQKTDRLGIRGGMVAALGGDVEALRGPSTVVVDLDGATLLPGFTDAHVHLLAGSFVLDRLLLLGVSSMEVMVTKVGTYAPTVPEEPWIVGYGWMRELVADPDGRTLDAVVSDRPVLLVDNSGHSAIVNSVALARAGITKDTPDPADGEIVRDPVTGEPTGYLLEGALSLVSEIALADYDDERLSSGLDAAIDTFSSGGITSIAEILASPGFNLARPWIYSARDQDLPLRIHWYAPVFEQADLARIDELREEWPDGDKVTFGGGKIWVDGSMGTSESWMEEPLEGTTDNYGAWYFDEAELMALAEEAEDRGIPLKLHMNGDAAVAAALSAFEAVAARRGGLSLPHVFDHVVLTDPEDRSRLAALGIVASMQPAHEIGTRAGDVAEDWGAERMNDAYDLRSMVDAGVPVALGTDWPVWPAPDALVQVWAATTQQQDQNLSLAHAIEAGTLGGAAALGREAELGSLEPGKLADFVIYDEDPLSIDPSDLTRVTLQQVWVGGERVR